MTNMLHIGPHEWCCIHASPKGFLLFAVASVQAMSVMHTSCLSLEIQ